jgi:hypothetical protein
MSDLTPQARQRYARLSGFLFLWLIATGLGGAMIVSHVLGSGSVSEVAQRAAASEHLYRLGLAIELLEPLGALMLGFALYATLRSVDRLIAAMALCWRAAEAVIGLVGMTFAYARLRLYLSDQPTQGLIDLTRGAGSATHNIAVLCFSIGSLLFFWLFWRSRTIPRILSGIGLLASVLVMIIGFAGLLAPEWNGILQYGWAPMAVAEGGAGLWLLVKGVKLDQPDAADSDAS